MENELQMNELQRMDVIYALDYKGLRDEINKKLLAYQEDWHLVNIQYFDMETTIDNHPTAFLLFNAI